MEIAANLIVSLTKYAAHLQYGHSFLPQKGFHTIGFRSKKVGSINGSVANKRHTNSTFIQLYLTVQGTTLMTLQFTIFVMRVTSFFL